MNTQTPNVRPPRVKPEKRLAAEHRARVLEYIEAAVPEKHKIATQRVLLGQVARATAVKIKCLQCCNYDREEVRGCTVITCALHPVRPYAGRADDDEVTDDPQAA